MYAEVGWIFYGPAYTNIPDGTDFKQFVLGKQPVYLYVHERDMIDLASISRDSEDYDETVWQLHEMSRESPYPSWDNLDGEYMNEKRREEDLTDRNGDDKWLKEGSSNDFDPSSRAQAFVDFLRGKTSNKINDPNQLEMNLEAAIRKLIKDSKLLFER